MSIGAVSTVSSVPFAHALGTKGLATQKIAVIEDDLDATIDTFSAAGLGTVAAPADAGDVWAALDARISADVASGKLSEDDAAAVRKTFDEMAQSGMTEDQGKEDSDVAQASGGPARSGGGGGAGGGETTEKTELSHTEVVSGAIKTTIITYTDGSSETKTSFDNGEVATTPAAANKASEEKAKEYLASLEPGLLFNDQA